MGINKTKQIEKNVLFTKGENFSRHTTIGIGGKIKYFCEPKSIKEYISVIEYSSLRNLPYYILGNGSNVLPVDKEYNGVVISTKKLNKIVYLKDNTVRSYAGTNLSELIDSANKKGLGGMEALYGIPATVGGATIMNAGAFNVNISDFIESVCVLQNGKKKVYKNKDLLFGYRNSIFRVLKSPIINVDFKFFNINAMQKREIINSYLSLRREKQPSGKNCGSVFKNPLGYSAGKLIESVGLKGYSVGGAEISFKHGNFIINKNSATYSDVKTLIEVIKKKIKEIYNIDLVEEIEYIGE